jgi:hypothetical protein
VRSLPEEALGRGVNPPETIVPARGRGWARMRLRPLVDSPDLNRALLAVYGLFRRHFPAAFRSIGGTPNYGTRQ